MSEKYLQLRAAGATPEQVYQIAQADGLDSIACLNLLKTVFGLTFLQAKEVSVRASALAESLDAWQGQLAHEMGLQSHELDEAKP